jgi:PKD repeat protein
MTEVGRKGGSIAVALLMTWASFLSIGLTLTSNVKAPTWVGGHVTGTVTWTEANSPYYVYSTITVDTNASLTIEAGVEIRVEYNPWPPYSFLVYGTLRSLGTANKSVTFTSNLTNPQTPSWGNITSNPGGHVELSHTTVEYVDRILLHSDKNYIGNSTISKLGSAMTVYSSYNTIEYSTWEYANITSIYFLGSMSGNTVRNNTFGFNDNYGIYLDTVKSGWNNLIVGNRVLGNGVGGIMAWDATGWTIGCNLFTDNGQWGIRTLNSNLTVSHNNVMNHTDNAYDNDWANMWDDGSKGNYWDDYNGTDTDGDGIGETPYYILPQNWDSYPFVNPISNCPYWGPVPQSPVAVARPRSQSIYVGDSAWFNGNDSYDPDGTIVEYYWTFGDGGWATGVNVSHVYGTPGTYSVMLRVTDNDGLTDKDYVSVTVIGYPIADARPKSQGVRIGQSAWFNGSNSHDPDGWIVSYYWTFGDGGTAWGENVSHVYNWPGSYVVTLTVTDNDNLTDTDMVSIRVDGYPPVADAGPNQTVHAKQSVKLNGSGSYDTDGWITDWYWDFGDGSAREHGEVVYHKYQTPGLYNATLWVTDNHNLTDVDEAWIEVLPELQWPVSDPDGPYSGRKNFPVLLTGNGSYDPDGTIVDLEWDFGDSSPTEHGWYLEHTYSSGGNFTITLWVTDNDALVNVSTTYAVIEDKAPGASVVQNAVLSGGSSKDVTLSWTLSTDDGGIENDVVAYEICYGTTYDKDGVGYSVLDTVSAGTSSYIHTDGGHSDNNTYFYMVKAVDDVGQKSFGGQAVKLARHLPVGMQLISIPVLLSNTTIQDVFKTVDFKVIRYYDANAGKRHNWRTFDTRKPYNSLKNVNETMALWIDITEESHLVAAGLVPESTTIRLVVGWNFIGYASFFDATVGDTFAGATYQNVEGYDPTNPPWFLMRLSDTDVMSFGKGYWIHVSEEFFWTVDN